MKAAIDAEPRLDGVPFVGPSFARYESRAKAGSLADLVDLGNIHPYTGGNAPSASHLASERTLAAIVSGDKPLVATEAGFHNALNATSGQPPVSEEVAATYTLRTLLEHFRAGVRRTFLYELTDQRPEPALANPEEHFGLLRHDLSEKPAFTALKNLLTVVGRPAPAEDLEPVEASVEGGTDVESLLLAGGRRHLPARPLARPQRLGPREPPPIEVAPQSVEVTLPTEAATLARPVESATPQPLAGEGGSFSVDVPADPVVITFERSDPRAGDPPPRDPPAGDPPPRRSARDGRRSARRAIRLRRRPPPLRPPTTLRSSPPGSAPSSRPRFPRRPRSRSSASPSASPPARPSARRSAGARRGGSSCSGGCGSGAAAGARDAGPGAAALGLDGAPPRPRGAPPPGRAPLVVRRARAPAAAVN